MVAARGFLVLTFVFLLFRAAFQQLGTAVPLRSREERAALLQLRSSLGLRSRDWPIRSDPCLVWVGVQCRNGSVIGINISGFRRTRIGSQNPQLAVDALANFTSLSSFNASRFSLPGSIPNWLGQQVSSLQVLDLRSCSILGAIPSSLGNLTSLTALYLSRNSLTGEIPSSLGQLSHLSIFDLSENTLTGSIPLSIAFLGNLTLLDISSNYLSGTIPPALGNLSLLQVLNLSSNSLSSSIPTQLGDLSNLVDLDLSLNSLSGSVPSDLRGLRNLQRLDIGNNMLTGALPSGLISLLTQLQIIVLNSNDFIGALPDALWSMPGLRLVDVSSNNFTGVLPNRTLNANRTATVFNLSNNMFYGGLTPVLSRFNIVDLSNNYFQGRVPDYVGSNATLSRNCLQNVSSQKTVEDCASFYSDRGLLFDNFGQPNNTQPPPPPRTGRRINKRLIILAGVLGGVLFIAILAAVLALVIFCTRKRGSNTHRSTGVGPVPTITSPPHPGVALNLSNLGEAFTYQKLLLSTDDFINVNLIKNGHSGDLFRGILEGGVPAVIKKIGLSSGRNDSCMQELDFFSKVSHPRLVPLLGHCLENENEKFLVYKHMRNGDLASSLYRKSNSEDDDSLQSLDWITRLKIATGAAEGLSYLHHECNPPLVHRDVQASSILLDDKYEVRLGSLSDVCAQEVDPHSKRFTRLLCLPQTSEQGASGTPTATCAYDVYCFGKVLLELVTGKLGISSSSDSTTKDLLEGTLPYISIYEKDLVTNIVDPSLIIDEDLLEEVWAMAVVARSCLNPKPTRRPLMRYILKALENPLKVVREESTSSSARLRTPSSRGSWNAALFGSWRHSSSDVAATPVGGGVPANRGDGGNSFKRSKSRSTGSGGSGGQNGGNGNDHSSSRRRQFKDIFPEPKDGDDE